MQGDLMIFAPGWLGSYWDGSGHVAIVRDVGPGYVDMVEQNATSSGTDRFAAERFARDRQWLHADHRLAPTDRADPGRACGDQRAGDAAERSRISPGNMDVIWRGTDAKLHDLAYRNESWQHVGVGHQRRYKRGVDPGRGVSGAGTGRRILGGHLGQSLAGAVAERVLRRGDVVVAAGAATWVALALGSAPAAVSPGARRDGGYLEGDRRTALGQQSFNGAWSAPMPLNSGAGRR